MSNHPPEKTHEKKPGIKEDTGFELDKIDLSALKEKAAASEPSKPADTPEKTVKRKKAKAKTKAKPDPTTGVSRKVKLAVVAASVLMVVLTAVFLVFREQIDIELPSIFSDDLAKPATYISVGPVITSIDSGDLIKMTLDINCTRKSHKKTIAELDSKIRNRVVWALQTPRAQYFMQSGDYFGLRSYMSTSVMEILPDNTVKEIYFSEFLRY